jgi:hypothetical protein
MKPIRSGFDGLEFAIKANIPTDLEKTLANGKRPPDGWLVGVFSANFGCGSSIWTLFARNFRGTDHAVKGRETRSLHHSEVISLGRSSGETNALRTPA